MFQSKKCGNFDDLRVISRDTHTDSRGEFYKIFNLDDLKKFGWKKAEPNEPSDFSLWDTYNKNDVDSVIKV